MPKVALINPHKAQGFRVIIRIAEHDDNRILSYGADCGGNAYASQQEVDARVFTKFYELRVVRDCQFQVCVHRVEKGKVKMYCDYYTAKTPEGGGP
jgi:hypothetical protein